MAITVESADKSILVELEDIGEGLGGDYDPADTEDVPLLRFTVYHRVDGEWEALDDASYCTQIPATTSASEQTRLARLLLSEVEEPAREHGRVKHLCERLSWINPSWGTKSERQGWVLG